MPGRRDPLVGSSTIPAFGDKNHIGIDRRHHLIRRWTVTDAAHHDAALLPELIDSNNTAGDVWADTAYRSQANEKFLAGRLLRSQIHVLGAVYEQARRQFFEAEGDPP